jgi:hypothetical protein
MSMYLRQSIGRSTRRAVLVAAIAAAGLLLPMTVFAQDKSTSKMELQSRDPLTSDIHTFAKDGRRGLDAEIYRPKNFVRDTRLLNSGAYTTSRPVDFFGSRMNRAGVGDTFGTTILAQPAPNGRSRGTAGKSSTGLRSGQTVLSPSLMGTPDLGFDRDAVYLGETHQGEKHTGATRRSSVSRGTGAHRP